MPISASSPFEGINVLISLDFRFQERFLKPCTGPRRSCGATSTHPAGPGTRGVMILQSMHSSPPSRSVPAGGYKLTSTPLGSRPAAVSLRSPPVAASPIALPDPGATALTWLNQSGNGREMGGGPGAFYVMAEDVENKGAAITTYSSVRHYPAMPRRLCRQIATESVAVLRSSTVR